MVFGETFVLEFVLDELLHGNYVSRGCDLRIIEAIFAYDIFLKIFES